MIKYTNSGSRKESLVVVKSRWCVVVVALPWRVVGVARRRERGEGAVLASFGGLSVVNM